MQRAFVCQSAPNSEYGAVFRGPFPSKEIPQKSMGDLVN